MVLELVRAARRRFLRTELVVWSTHAVTAVLAGLVLLLLLGTQVLTWHWLLILPAITLAGGVCLAVRRLPPLYRVAQVLDQRLSLADCISTALFFATTPAAKCDESMRRAQLAHAERVARGADLSLALPFRGPRGLYAAIGLAMLACSLFALRYGLSRRLDLRPPLARILHQAFGADEQQAALEEKKKKESVARRPDLQDALGFSVPDSDGKLPGELDAAPDSALDTVGVPETDNKGGATSADTAKGKTPGAEPIQGEQGEGEAVEGAEASAAGQNAEGQQGQGKQQNPQSGGKQASGASGDKSSLMSKLRDAMQNLLSRMRQQPSGGTQQSAMSQDGRQGEQQGSGQNARAGRGQRQSSGQEADSQEGQPGEDAQNAQGAQSRGAGQSADQQASKQPGSGIGRQDGSKDVKLAEQLAAMGKISEIIGKRAANVSGEITVEVPSGNQQLRTAYTQRNAVHADAGGEISRDEVPVVFQAYVQQYFEQIRKQEPVKRR